MLGKNNVATAWQNEGEKGLQSEVKTKPQGVCGQIGVEMRARKGVQGW
jgi:hypothetical protein